MGILRGDMPPRRNLQKALGFTLVEAVITVAILALMAGISIPMVSNVTRGDLRAGCALLGQSVRQAYQYAALSGSTHALKFNFEKRSLSMLRVPGSVGFSGDGKVITSVRNELDEIAEETWESQAFLAARKEAEDEGDIDSSQEDEGISSGALLQAMAGKSSGSRAPAEFEEVGKPVVLPGSIAFLDIWQGGKTISEEDGEASMYFFPHGFTQRTIVHLKDEDGLVYSVSVSALTGNVKIDAFFVEGPKL